jgi:penicillin G amidase
MFENDDVDFYYEEKEGDNVKFNNSWTPIKYRNEEIKVKDSVSVMVKVGETEHGPIINSVFETFPKTKQPVSVWWSYLKFPSRNLEATYKMNHAKSMEEAKLGASLVHAPGLNVMYGDNEGNIAWWASAKLVKRRPEVQTKRFLNGANGQDEPLGWYPFEMNPHAENPSSGFVYSANGQPDSISLGIFYPGYYVPENRAVEIVSNLQPKNDWTADDMRKLITNSKSSTYEKFAKQLLQILESIDPQEIKTETANRLSSWEGEHGLESIGSVIYYRWIYYILKGAMEDELGATLFNAYMNTHFMKTSYPGFISTYSSIWWNNVHTEREEIRAIIVKEAWFKMKDELKERFGKEEINWKWKKTHTVEHVHPIGRRKPFNYFFNVGPFEINGGNEVINNTGFNIDSSGNNDVKFGPAMRRIIDFADIEHSYSVLPTGQSGYFMAPHYSDQAELYNSNGFRLQLLDKKQIQQQAESPLILKPSN